MRAIKASIVARIRHAISIGGSLIRPHSSQTLCNDWSNEDYSCKLARKASKLVRELASSYLWGLSRSRVKGVGLEYVGLRDYHPGDDIKYVEWRATARRINPDGSYRLVVKEFEDERLRETIILLDKPKSLKYFNKVYAASYAASLLASYSLSLGDRLAILHEGEGGCMASYPTSISEALALISKHYCERSWRQLDTCLKLASRIASPRSTIVMVSDYSVSKSAIRCLYRITRSKNTSTLLMLTYSVKEVKPPVVDGYVMLVGDDGKSIKASLHEFYSAVQSYVAELKAYVKALSIPLTTLCVENLMEATPLIIRRYLEARMRLA